jgi:hypothetical protein
MTTQMPPQDDADMSSPDSGTDAADVHPHANAPAPSDGAPAPNPGPTDQSGRPGHIEGGIENLDDSQVSLPSPGSTDDSAARAAVLAEVLTPGTFGLEADDIAKLTASDPSSWDPAKLKVSFANIPHRQWMYSTFLVRGEITVLAAPGGAGKTALAISMSAEIAAGAPKLGEKLWTPEGQKVLYINGEDSRAEITRRLCGFCQRHQLTEHDLSCLYVVGADDPRVQSLSFLRMSDRATVLNDAAFSVLEAALQSLRPDLLVLDPLVVFCGGNMNDNALMSLVMRKLKAVAVKYNCALLVVHHTRKGGSRAGDTIGDAEGISGAAAIVNLARRALMPVTMTELEAKELGLLPSQRLQHFKLVDAKSNLSPLSDKSPWFELVNEELPNSQDPPYPNGDRVQAVKRVHLARSKASHFVGAEQQTIRFELLKMIDRGLTIEGENVLYSPNSTGSNKKRAILENAIATVRLATPDREWLQRDLRATVERELEALKQDGWVVVERITKGRFRRGHGLRVLWERTPWAKERENLHQHGGPTVRTEQEQEELNQRDLQDALREMETPSPSTQPSVWDAGLKVNEKDWQTLNADRNLKKPGEAPPAPDQDGQSVNGVIND